MWRADTGTMLAQVTFRPKMGSLILRKFSFCDFVYGYLAVFECKGESWVLRESRNLGEISNSYV